MAFVLLPALLLLAVTLLLLVASVEAALRAAHRFAAVRHHLARVGGTDGGTAPRPKTKTVSTQ